MNNFIQGTLAATDDVDLCRLLDYVVDAGFLSVDNRSRVSTKSLDDFLSSFSPLLSESVAAMLFPVGLRGNMQPPFKVDLPQALYRMWCGLEESSLAAVAANIIAEDLDSNDYLIPFQNGMALRSCAEVHEQHATAASWLSRILNRCSRRVLRHSFANMACQVLPQMREGCSQRANSASLNSPSLAARARRLSSEGDMRKNLVDVNGGWTCGSYREDITQDAMAMAHRESENIDFDMEVARRAETTTHLKEHTTGESAEAVATNFTWAAPANDTRHTIGPRPTRGETHRSQVVSNSSVHATTSTSKLKPEGPFSAALWSVPHWAVNGEACDPKHQQGWRRW